MSDEDYPSDFFGFIDNIRENINTFESMIESNVGDISCSHAQTVTSDELTTWVWAFARQCGKMGLTSRIGECISMMYLWYDSHTINGVRVDNDKVSSNTKRILRHCDDDSMTIDKIERYYKTGKRIIKHVKAFGWAILLWDKFDIRTISYRKAKHFNDCLTEMNGNERTRNRIRDCFEEHITDNDMKQKIVRLIGSICNNNPAINEIIMKLDAFLKTDV